MFMYSIYDKSAKMHSSAPFFAESDEHAKRIVMNSFSRESQLIMYPSSYDIVCHAEWIPSADGSSHGSVNSNVYHIVCGLTDLIPDGLVDFVLDGSVKK